MPSVRWSRFVLTVPLVAALALVPACGDDDDDAAADGGETTTDAGTGDGGDGGADGSDPAVALVPGADLAAGAETFGSVCATCHGDDGGGGIGPNLQGVADRLSVEEHVRVVREGRGAMPAMGDLSDDQVAQVVRYEREGLGG